MAPNISSRSLRLPRGVALLAVLVGSACLETGCAAAPQPRACGSSSLDTRASAPATVYLIRRGWHIDVGFPTAELEPSLSELGAEFPSARSVSLGFGDRHYLEARNKSFPGLLAALWPGAGLILATGLPADPGTGFGEQNVLVLAVSRDQSHAAQAFVRESLSPPPGVSLQRESTGPYPGSTYFASSRRYSALYTCNTWAAQVLEAAGLPVRSQGVALAGQLWSQARRINCRAGSSRPGKPPSFSSRPEPRRSSSRAEADCCC